MQNAGTLSRAHLGETTALGMRSGRLPEQMGDAAPMFWGNPRRTASTRDAEPKDKRYTHTCRICQLPILRAHHDRHTDGNGTYHMSCERGEEPLYLKWLLKEAGRSAREIAGRWARGG